MIHSHVWGSHRAKFEDDDFNSFRGIAALVRDRHIHTGIVYVNFFSLKTLWKQMWGTDTHRQKRIQTWHIYVKFFSLKTFKTKNTFRMWWNYRRLRSNHKKKLNMKIFFLGQDKTLCKCSANICNISKKQQTFSIYM